jgi:hypothetical protein
MIIFCIVVGIILMLASYTAAITDKSEDEPLILDRQAFCIALIPLGYFILKLARAYKNLPQHKEKS